jgi:nitric oxide reductase subunit C
MWPKKSAISLLILVSALILAACSGDNATAGDSINSGKELYEQATLGSAAGCKTCHSLEPGTVIIGPSMAGIGTVAASRVSGMSAEEYLKKSIVDPNAFVAEGFPASVMPNTYITQLTEEEIDKLVAYLLSLDGSGN